LPQSDGWAAHTREARHRSGMARRMRPSGLAHTPGPLAQVHASLPGWCDSVRFRTRPAARTEPQIVPCPFELAPRTAIGYRRIARAAAHDSAAGVGGQHAAAVGEWRARAGSNPAAHHGVLAGVALVDAR
jgi:hypothetical protein